jgi:hypothetical protein
MSLNVLHVIRNLLTSRPGANGLPMTSNDLVKRPATAAVPAMGAHHTLGAAFAGHVEPRTARTRCQVALASPPLAEALRHARLPAWPGCFPSFDHVDGEANRDELSRIVHSRSPTLVHDCTRQCLFGKLRELTIFVSANGVCVNPRKVRFQRTGRDGFFHGRLPFAC